MVEGEEEGEEGVLAVESAPMALLYTGEWAATAGVAVITWVKSVLCGDRTWKIEERRFLFIKFA